MKIRLRRITAVAAAMVVAATAAGCGNNSDSTDPDSSGEPQAASNYPERSIEMWVGVSAGGGTDSHARILAESLQSELGKPVVVVNKPGAGGIAMWSSLPTTKPDGYVISLVSFPQVAGEFVRGNLAFDPTEKLTFIGNASLNPTALATAADAPYDDLAGLVAAAKADPGGIKVGTTGTGSLDYISVESVARAAGVKFTYVPFEGTTEGINAVLSGDIDVMGMGLVSAGEFVKSRDLKLLAIGADERLDTYPDVGTYVEQGYEILGGKPVAYFTVVAPPGLPADISQKLQDALKAATESADYREKIEAIGGQVAYLDPADTKELVEGQIPELQKIVDAG